VKTAFPETATRRNATGTGVQFTKIFLSLLPVLWAAADIFSLDTNFQNISLEMSFYDRKYDYRIYPTTLDPGILEGS